MAYTSKKASVMYAPFRDAVESTFQDDPSIISIQWVAQVTPPWLSSLVPVVCYLDLGEYKMVKDYGDSNSLENVVREAHIGLLRAGASVLITYFTPYILDHCAKW
ncbi:hypothetical protein PsorP6_005013 [Peronosclerospora sorghi]|uniref:Uncharacterized protein n=1 Tax=Peronosclerospora sorghi TaxID=230839 RepID=A0ACC0W1U7_9STRA|nr:hypothetical protein PsorP6_005013 [Peronosclerospora sorghi]